MKKRFDGQRVRVRREAKKWSQDDLLVELRNAGLDISKGTISNWERSVRVPRMDEGRVLAETLGCAPEDFFCVRRKEETAA